MSLSEIKGLTYKSAGVDIDAGNKAVELMKTAVQNTYTAGVLGDVGGFGGLFSLSPFAGFREPVLVSGTDGVGTKLRLAIMADKHDTIGQDCVAMSVNDILVQGAVPLFFLDYIAVGKLDPVQVATIVKGVASACKESGCALLGGETAEMAGFYSEGDYDVAGFAVGIVDKAKLITGERIAPGDVILGLPSSGIHSNGFSLVRKIVFERAQKSLEEFIPDLDRTLGEELLIPTRLYPRIITPLLNEFDIKGMVHITGGGYYENIPRILPVSTSARVFTDTWPVLPIFKLLQQWGNVDVKEMYRTFNMGLGMLLVVSPNEARSIMDRVRQEGEEIYEIGVIEARHKDSLILEGRDFK